MPKPITLKIDVTKLDKSLFFKSSRTGAVYCDLVCWPKNETGQYGDTHLVRQNRPKDSDRDMPIVGNMTVPEYAETDDAPPSNHQQKKQDGYAPDTEDEDDEIPF